MRKYVITLFFAFLFFFYSFAQRPHRIDQQLAGMDSVFSNIQKDYHVAGFAIAVVNKDSVIYSKGFGYRDVKQKKPVTPNTLFCIGSCTKAFTAALMGQLDKTGRISLDGKATGYLPSLHYYNDYMNNTITVRDLMCHRTGLSRYDNSWYVFNSSSRDSVLTRIRFMKPTAEVREKWQYNNLMFMVQALIAEKVTGKSWEENIQQQIFSPLAMKRSSSNIEAMIKDEDASLAYSTASADTTKQLEYYHTRAMAPAGGINSSAKDMAQWVMTWLNKGVFKGIQVLPASFVDQAQSSQMVVGGFVPGKGQDIYFLNYGLGWFLRSFKGHYEVEHDGNIDGFSSWVSFFPADDFGIVVLSNQQNSVVPQMLSNIIANHMLGLPLKDIYKRGDHQQVKKEENTSIQPASGKVTGTKPSHNPDEYTGTFENPAYGDITIFTRHDSLLAAIGTAVYFLSHYHYDVFEALKIAGSAGYNISQTNMRVNFRFGENGKVQGITLPLEATEEPDVDFAYVLNAVSVNAADLQQYTGAYVIGNMGAKVYIKDNGLYMLAEGQPEYHLVAVGNDNFIIESLTGFKVNFIKDSNDKVHGFNFIKPDGTSFKVPRKD